MSLHLYKWRIPNASTQVERFPYRVASFTFVHEHSTHASNVLPSAELFILMLILVGLNRSADWSALYESNRWVYNPENIVEIAPNFGTYSS